MTAPRVTTTGTSGEARVGTATSASSELNSFEIAAEGTREQIRMTAKMGARVEFMAEEFKTFRQDFMSTLRALEPVLSGIRQDLAAIKGAMPHLTAKSDLIPYVTTRGLATFIGLLVLFVGLGVTGLLWATGTVIILDGGTLGASP